jgi:hypothetical protein
MQETNAPSGPTTPTLTPDKTPAKGWRRVVAKRKYEATNLIPMFRLAAKLCSKEMRDAGFTDSGGAIHSAERILDLLGRHLVYPALRHINNLRNLPAPPFSAEAKAAHASGKKVLIEHVAPLRALTRLAIDKIENVTDDGEFAEFILAHYRLALLTPGEAQRLNRQTRSIMGEKRLERAGIEMAWGSRK